MFGIKLLDENQTIPLLYWTSKQHKDPYKFRFIAGVSHCYNKQIAADLLLYWTLFMEVSNPWS